MNLQPDSCEEGVPIVTLQMDMRAAKWAQQGLADAACWMRGYMAGSGENSQYDPMGLDEIRELNTALKRALDEADE